jgi:Tol biopolymer transport system component
VVSADGGASRQLTQHGARLEGLTWAADRQRIIFASSRGSTIWYLPRSNLWTIEADGTGLRQLTFGEESYAYPDTNASGTIVVSRVRRQFDIWRYPVEHPAADNVRGGLRITEQTSDVHTPSVSPGDRELAYVSDSGGHANIWTVNLETRQSRQITFESNPDVRVGLPLWSPAGTISPTSRRSARRGTTFWSAQTAVIPGCWFATPGGPRGRRMVAGCTTPISRSPRIFGRSRRPAALR